MSKTTSRRPGTRHGLAAVAASASVLLVSLGFYGYASALGGSGPEAGYELNATFLSSNGLHAGADVVLAGIKVGTVSAITLDAGAMTARVRFEVQRDLRLPVDTRLSIGSSTLTSGNALMILPGKSSQILAVGATVTRTCELTSLEQQVSDYIFGSGGASSDCGSD